MDQVTVLKDRGNAALSNGNFDEAIKIYTQAIEIDGNNHVLYSNRSAAYAKAGNYEASLEDAEKTIQLKPTWSKGYSRKGSALVFLGRNDEAITVYEEGLEIDPSNDQLKASLQEICAQKEAEFPVNSNPFSGPDVMEKLQNNPTTKKWLSDPDYVKLLQDMQLNKKRLDSVQDDRLIKTLGVILGLDSGEEDMDIDAHFEVKNPAKDFNFGKAKRPLDKDETVPENKRLSEAEKAKGNDFYKKKDFESALKHYNAAVELDPTNIAFYSNIAAVYFEQKEYKKCIEQCESAIEIGRENRADFKLIAKAFTRIGNAYKKMEEWKLAKTFYEKSMSEHRTPEIKTLLSDIDKKIKDEEKKAYIDPKKAEEEKELGNDFFKKGDYGSAVKHYTEAIKRNPDDPKLYSNRAACYTKLAAFDLGLKDCEQCCKLDPKFIKGWIRKGKILQGMQQYSKATTAYQQALELDDSNAEALEGYRSCTMQLNSNPEEVRKKAMNDPEVQAILRDPAMRVILEQMQQDQHALQDHLKNPEIAAKIQKLLESGLIAIH